MSKRQIKVPRKTTLSMIINSEKKQKVLLEYKDGKLMIYGEDGKPMRYQQVEVVRSRERSGKVEKIISYIGNNDIASLDVENFIRGFSEIYAVDTNTKQIGEIYYSKGVLSKLVKVLNGFPQSYEIKTIYIISSENKMLKPEMEQAVWNRVISEIQKISLNTQKIGLVVDCDLGNIKDYNKRKLKIRNDKFLPDNFALIYASADVNDNIFNKMIRFCDREATRQLNEIEEEYINDKR